MKFVCLTIFILLINCAQFRADEEITEDEAPSEILADEVLPKAKVFGVTQTNESIAVRFGDSVTLRDPIDKDETNEEWYLSRGDSIMTIYENGKLNAEIDKDNVQCLPSSDNCEALVIKNFTKKWIGQVLRQSKKDKLSINFYQFLLTGYEAPLKIKCASDKMHACHYNETKNTLYVREDKQVILDCSALLWKYVDYDSPVEIHVNDCEDEPDIKTLQGTREGFKQYQITSRCKKTFSKTDKSFTCVMKYSKIERGSFILDQLDVKLEIEFGPIYDAHEEKDLIKTIAVGKGVSLKCPISGHPIKYYWKEIKNGKNDQVEEKLGTKDFQVPKFLPDGVYNYECRGEINNAVASNSESIKFQVTIGGAAKSKKNLGILIGSIVGGCLGLVLIVLIIICIVKKGSGKNRGKGQAAHEEEDIKFRK